MTGAQREIKDLTHYNACLSSLLCRSSWFIKGISHLTPRIIFLDVCSFCHLFSCPPNWAEVVWGLLTFDGWSHHCPYRHQRKKVIGWMEISIHISPLLKYPCSSKLFTCTSCYQIALPHTPLYFWITFGLYFKAANDSAVSTQYVY